MSKREPRTAAEWVAFGISVFVLVVVIGLVLVESASSDTPAAPTVRRDGPARVVRGRYFVPVVLTNEGDRTATEVQVVARLTLDGSEVQADQLVEFLAGGESARLEFAFETDPDKARFSVAVTGYQEP